MLSSRLARAGRWPLATGLLTLLSLLPNAACDSDRNDREEPLSSVVSSSPPVGAQRGEVLPRTTDTPMADRVFLDQAARDGTGSAADGTGEANRPPFDMRRVRTTTGELLVRNLEGWLREWRGRLETQGRNAFILLNVAAIVDQRARVLGRLEDTEEALALVEEALAESPASTEGLILRASLRSRLHHFEPALADLEAAVAAGAPETSIADQRAEIHLALGRYAEASPVIESRAREETTWGTLASLGNLYADRGNVERADFLFGQAPDFYPDTHPMPLAWLHVQHGHLYLRNHQPERALEFFQAAHDRFPQYALARAYLAQALVAVGRFQEAASHYRALAEQTNNPEYYAGLAEAERWLGNAEAASAAEGEARRLYEALLVSHPEATWQHAARFFLRHQEVPRAIELARQNVALRQDIASLLLLAESELAGYHEAEACAAWGRAVTTGLEPPELVDLRPRFAQCTAPAEGTGI